MCSFASILLWIEFVVVWVYTVNCMSPHAAVRQGVLPKAHGSRGPAEKREAAVQHQRSI